MFSYFDGEFLFGHFFRVQMDYETGENLGQNINDLFEIEDCIWGLDSKNYQDFSNQILTYISTNSKMLPYLLNSISRAFYYHPLNIKEFGLLYEELYKILPQNYSNGYFEHNLLCKNILPYQISSDLNTQIDENSEFYSNSIQKILFDDNLDEFIDETSKPGFGYFEVISLKPLYNKSMGYLNCAAFFGSLKIFKFLFMQKTSFIDPNTLYYAVCGGNLEIIHLCLNKIGSHKKGMTGAIKSHRNEIVQYLIDNFDEKVDPDVALLSCNSKAFFYAFNNYQFDYLDYLSFAGKSCHAFAFDSMIKRIRTRIMLPHETIQNIIRGIASGGSAYICKQFFKNFTCKELSLAILEAVRSDRDLILKELLPKDSKNAKQIDTIIMACRYGCLKSIILLYKDGYPINDRCVELAIKYEKLHVFKYIFPIYLKTSMKYRDYIVINDAMNVAIANDNLALINLYIEQSHKYWKRFDKLILPHQIVLNACYCGALRIVNGLFALGYQPGSFMDLMKSAIIGGKLSCLKILFENGADVNEVDQNGTSPLMKAALENKYEIVEYLLEKGANVWIKNKFNETAYKIAVYFRYMKIKKAIFNSVPFYFVPFFLFVENRTFKYSVVIAVILIFIYIAIIN